MRNHETSPYSLTGTVPAEAGRTFMQRVYWWMSFGLALTGAVAFGVASSPALSLAIRPWLYPLMFAQLAVALGFSFLRARVSGAVAAGMFLLYAGLTGLTFSTLFLVFRLDSIASAFFVSAGTFAAMSVYGTVTKRDLSAWRAFLFMGLIGILIASVVNIFLGSALVGYVQSIAAVLVFAGLTAYDTQKLREMHADPEGAGSLALSGALMLYLDFVNLFLNLLFLMGRRRD
jgi:uncharacterized protein